ncbi:ion transporter [Leptobacterium flavescens]|uniref:Ion transporter n=1 Tax=Leptobacterium flavescens TaxID=472055 RepID=A0A6P0UJB5_9FLAO|nr:ion channel [Leptobacterium flavescens]NER13304.1 ion transporter [Leptobacterium flavescens]
MAKTKQVADPGFGRTSAENVQRFVNKDGTFNIKHINHKNQITNTFSYLIDISWPRFFLLIFLGYVVINSVFAIIYLLIGLQHLNGATGNMFYDFLNAFFFSAQTITTVGYGKMSPSGTLAGVISTIQALVGLLSFSFITGLLYGRFAKPRSFVKFSEKIIHRPFNGGTAIMFRIMNMKKTVMLQPKITVTLSLLDKDDDGYKSRFFKLALEREQISYLPTTWTIVHEIKEESPLFGYSREELKKLKGEFIVLATYFDESFNQDVHRVYSYTLEEISFDRIFDKAFEFDGEGVIVLDHEKLNRTNSINS